MIKSRFLSFVKYLKAVPVVGSIVITAFYFFGIVGILTDFKDWFIEKTAFNLALSFVVLMLYQKKYKWGLLWGFIFCFLIGFSAEYLGVNYGLIFGDYLYPDTLGPQIGGVPLIIGINWFLITFCVASIIFPMKLHILFKILLATVITVGIDFMIEPVAMELDFWNWENDVVPIQNYIGWAIISFLIFCFYAIIKIPVKNTMAVILLVWQILFFASLNILLVR